MKCILLKKPALTTLLLTVSLSGGTLAQDTTFTYQGRLESANLPANIDHGFLVRLFDAPEGGNQIGSTVCKQFVAVVNGLFTLELDFGPAVSSESPRFLDIQVKEDGDCNDLSGYIPLVPRQRLTATPMAVRALEAEVAEAAGLAEHAGFADLASAAQRLDAPDGSPTGAVFVNNNGNVGIGTTTPGSPLHILAPNVGTFPGEGLRIQGSLSSSANQAYASFHNGSGAALGYVGDGSTGDNNVFVASYQADVSLVTPAGRLLNATAGGRVGIGTQTPVEKLDVRGNVKLGPSGEFFAASGDENLRIVRGSVFSNGNPSLGAGYSSVRTGVGHYSITFNPPFSTRPVVTASTVGQVRFFATIESNSSSQATVHTVSRSDDEGYVDAAFHFIAIGPR